MTIFSTLKCVRNEYIIIFLNIYFRWLGNIMIWFWMAMRLLEDPCESMRRMSSSMCSRTFLESSLELWITFWKPWIPVALHMVALQLVHTFQQVFTPHLSRYFFHFYESFLIWLWFNFLVYFPGLDRLHSIVCETLSIRDVIAFPKGHSGRDLMADAPSSISQEDLKLYRLKVS